MTGSATARTKGNILTYLSIPQAQVIACLLNRGIVVYSVQEKKCESHKQYCGDENIKISRTEWHCLLL